MASYVPVTINTSQVTLGSDLEELVERLAENNHNHWARLRMDEGWRFGPERNDREKRRPDLVPYTQLPESEEEFDRMAVVEAIKTIIALGYQVSKP